MKFINSLIKDVSSKSQLSNKARSKLHSSHRIEIEGDSLRPKYSNLNQKFENN